MDIRVVLFTLVFLGGFFFSSLGNNSKNRRNYIIFMMIILTLESCLRGLSVGPDTLNYYWMFKDDGNMNWNNVFTALIDRYINNESEFDAGFIFFNKLIYSITTSFSLYLVFCALFFFVPFGILLNRYTCNFKQLIFIFTLYVSLFNMIAMSGVRKEIALGCSIWATLALIDKNYKQLVISLTIGTFIHMSTLLWLLVPLFSLFDTKILRLLHISGLCFVPIVIAASSYIIIYMGTFVGMEKYAEYGMNGVAGGALTFTLLIELISLFCLIAYRKFSFEKGSYMHILYTTLPCFSFFAPLITNNGSMVRISQYFHLYILLLFPFAIDSFFKKKSSIIYFICCILLIFLSLQSGYEPYYFIWEDNSPY